MVGKNVIIFLLHITAALTLPISNTTESDQPIVFSGVQNTEKEYEKPTVLLPDVKDAGDVYDAKDSNNSDEKSLGISDKDSLSNGNSSSEVTTSNETATSEIPTTQPATTQTSIIIQPTGLPRYCFRDKTIYVIKFIPGTRIRNGTLPIIAPTCCEGYAGDLCEITTCAGLKCVEDPDSRCVAIERCGAQLPIFFNKDGLVSQECKQPELTELNMCPNNTDVCHADSTCKGFRNRNAVCLGSGLTCDCSREETWFLDRVPDSGKLAECE